jgi:accessory colonization factor AcfC
MSEKITKVKLPEPTEKALAAFMAREMISTMDKNVVIARALEVYLEKHARTDAILFIRVGERSEARSKRGKDAWESRT